MSSIANVTMAFMSLMYPVHNHPVMKQTVSKSALVSVYGPGLWGNKTSSGIRLVKGDHIIANKVMRFGTKCTFHYRGRTAYGVVQDRGPFVSGRTFDLEQSLASQLNITGLATVKYLCH